VIVQFLFPLAIPPVILRIARKGRSPLQLIERDVGSISAQLGIVDQLPPGDRVLVRANPKKAAEGHDRIGDTSADLFDHQSFDAADIIPTRIVHGGTFDPVALD
jgi:hypothetical protein